MKNDEMIRCKVNQIYVKAAKYLSCTAASFDAYSDRVLEELISLNEEVKTLKENNE